MSDNVVPIRRNRRATVQLTPVTERALQSVMDADDVSLDEALRRLIGYGEKVFRTIRLEGGEVLTRHGMRQESIRLTDNGEKR